MKAMNAALAWLAEDKPTERHILNCADLRKQIGFDDYDERAEKMRSPFLTKYLSVNFFSVRFIDEPNLAIILAELASGRSHLGHTLK